jgi:site-specific DNA-methyltransferase (adenine-specific)
LAYQIVHADCIDWLRACPPNSFQAVITDPPFALKEFEDEELEKRAQGKGGIWRIPPAFDGHLRAPLPRFTVLSKEEISELRAFFGEFAQALLPTLVPGAHIFIAATTHLSPVVFDALDTAGFERRGEIVRLVRTLRGGDRPKNAETEFPQVCVTPRSCWEPWGLFRKPIEGRVQNNLRRWKTGGLRRLSATTPFLEVIPSERTPARERAIAAHPALKPQSFLRQLAYAALPLGEGTLLDPFCGSGSTLAACEALGLTSLGIERRADYSADRDGGRSSPGGALCAASALPSLSACADLPPQREQLALLLETREPYK